MTMLVTLAEAKRQLNIVQTNTYFDTDIELKIQIASDILLTFCDLEEVPEEWIDDSSPSILTVPATVKGVVLVMTAEMFTNRESSISDPLSETVKNILRMKWRTPPT